MARNPILELTGEESETLLRANPQRIVAELLNLLILGTPSGQDRNCLTNINIKLMAILCETTDKQAAGQSSENGIQHIWACSCGLETPCTFADMKIGGYFQCPSCGESAVGVVSKRGRKEFVKLDREHVDFLRLFEQPGENEL